MTGHQALRWATIGLLVIVLIIAITACGSGEYNERYRQECLDKGGTYSETSNGAGICTYDPHEQ